ncbi:MAG TPA: c-type cytochrome, partial [Vicinamibacterales bacterium]|nr:c-type cytochrome [Vicinamibacterales bacterium]
MNSVRGLCVLALGGAGLVATVALSADRVRAHDPKPTPAPHVHVPVPAEYQNLIVPSGLWTDRAFIARGRQIYEAKCAVCHGRDGAGDGPAAAGLAVKPPSLRDE